MSSKTVFSTDTIEDIAEHRAFVATVAADITADLWGHAAKQGGVTPDQLQTAAHRFLDARYPSSDVGLVLLRLYRSWEFGVRGNGVAGEHYHRDFDMEPQEFAATLILLAMSIAESNGAKAYGSALELFELWLTDAQSEAGAEVSGA